MPETPPKKIPNNGEIERIVKEMNEEELDMVLADPVVKKLIEKGKNQV